MLAVAIESGIRLYEWHAWVLTIADDRVKDWWLMGSTMHVIYIVIAYLLTVWLSPFVVRKPWLTARWPMVLYNTSMSLLNAYICVELCANMYRASYDPRCQPVSRATSGPEFRIACALHWFYLSKFFEMADTVFFILRCKWNQLTFLHIYHHASMLILWYIGVRWVPGGSATPCAALNSAVHIVMYYYYARTAAFPETKIWWKKYLTTIQLIQFVIALTLGMCGLYIDCSFPSWMGFALVLYMISFLVLFGNFYQHAYNGVQMEIYCHVYALQLSAPRRKPKTSSNNTKSSDTTDSEGTQPCTNGSATSKRPNRQRQRRSMDPDATTRYRVANRAVGDDSDSHVVKQLTPNSSMVME